MTAIRIHTVVLRNLTVLFPVSKRTVSSNILLQECSFPLESVILHFTNREADESLLSVTETTSEILGKHRQKEKPWITAEIFDLCDKRRELRKKRFEPEVSEK